jgi:hypothetical protein
MLLLLIAVHAPAGEPQSDSFKLVRGGVVAGATMMSSAQYRLELLTLAGESGERVTSPSHVAATGPLPQIGTLPSGIFSDGFESAN